MRYITSICAIAAALALSACGSTTTTASAPGISTINLQGGGTALSTLGGNGGSITIGSFSDVKVKSDGTVATTFTVPTLPSALGDNPFTVTGNQTVKLSNDPTLVNGELFVNVDGDMNLHKKASSGPDVVTSLKVAAGATLTLPVNVTALNAAALIIPNSVVIDGALQTKDSGTNLYLEAGNAGPPSSGLLQVGSSGKVTTTGGGFLFLFSWGSLVNQGALDASGVGSDGNAGFIELESFGFLYNTGKVTAKGGDAAAGLGGNGGNGNRIAMTAFNASLNTSGAIDNSGGTGDGGGNGGNGGVIYLLGGINDGSNPFANIVSTAMGRVLIGGTLTSNGGQSTTGVGGSAATNGALALIGTGIFLESEQSGQLLVNAKITAKGGATTGATGGSGGILTLDQHFGADLASANPAPIEGIKLGSVIDLAGGAGVTGGSGGSINIANTFSPDALPSSSSTNNTAGLPIIELDGYSKITLSGGAAGGKGGDAGTFRILTASPILASLVFPAPAISNTVAITATGGDGTATGGVGGFLDWQVGGLPHLPPPVPVYENAFQEQLSVLDSKGTINISGGTGDTGGTGGHLFFYGYTLKSTGAVTAKGGKGVAKGGSGTFSVLPLEILEMHATLDLTNSAAITATGGSGISGGDGATLVTLTAGNKVTNNGSISANGGAGTTGAGGSGHVIDLQSGYRVTSNSGVLNVAKGAGTPPGTDGRVIIDFNLQK